MATRLIAALLPFLFSMEVCRAQAFSDIWNDANFLPGYSTLPSRFTFNRESLNQLITIDSLIHAADKKIRKAEVEVRLFKPISHISPIYEIYIIATDDSLSYLQAYQMQINIVTPFQSFSTIPSLKVLDPESVHIKNIKQNLVSTIRNSSWVSTCGNSYPYGYFYMLYMRFNKSIAMYDFWDSADKPDLLTCKGNIFAELHALLSSSERSISNRK